MLFEYHLNFGLACSMHLLQQSLAMYFNGLEVLTHECLYLSLYVITFLIYLFSDLTHALNRELGIVRKGTRVIHSIV